MQARAARSWNNGVGISVEPLFIAEIRDRRVDPQECVLIAGNGLELICQQRFVALDDGLAVCISRDDATVSSRFLTAPSFLEAVLFMARSPNRQFSETAFPKFWSTNRGNRRHLDADLSGCGLPVIRRR